LTSILADKLNLAVSQWPIGHRESGFGVFECDFFFQSPLMSVRVVEAAAQD